MPFTLFAQITYIDATPANMSRVDGQTFSPSTASNVYTDSNWSLRSATGLASHGTIYESGGGETVPVLKQRQSGIAPGLYHVYAYFWVATNVGWQITTGLSASNMVNRSGTQTVAFGAITFSPYSNDHQIVTLADLSSGVFSPSFAPTQATGGADRTLARVDLGLTAVGNNGVLEVFVSNGPSNGNSTNSRTWYDGLGYSLATAAEGSTGISNNSWSIGLNNTAVCTLSNSYGRGVLWGDGTDKDADDTAVHASIDSNLLTPESDPIVLADGESVELSGIVNLQTSIVDTTNPNQFRWGLFHHNGSSNATGWTGYWLGNGTNGTAGSAFRQNSSSTLYIGSNTATGSFLSATQSATGHANLSAGAHRFQLVLTRRGTTMAYSGSLYRLSDELLLTEISGVDASATLYNQFSRIGFLSGNNLDAERLILSSVTVVYPYTAPALPTPGSITQIAPNGTWTWFNDERAIWHNGVLLAGYMRNDGYAGITRYDPATNKSTHSNIGTATSLQVDDHNNPSLTILPDQRVLATYSKHGSANQFYTRISTNSDPRSLSDWGAETVVTTPAGNTYANTMRLSGSGVGENNTIYNFSRCINYNPCLTRSTTNGASWGSTVQVINVGTGGTRPYPRYVTNQRNRIDMIYTDGHPRNENNSIYHLYYQGETFYKSDGTAVKTLAQLPLNHGAISDPNSGEKGTTVYQFSTATWSAGQGANDWIPNGRAWTWDIHYGTNGDPVCAFQVQVDDAASSDSSVIKDRIYYYYARWTGSSWQRRFIAQAGRPLYAAEDDYGGGMSLDPEDPRVVYISSNAAKPFDLSSLTQVPLAVSERYDIWRGITLDGGLSFNWTRITENTGADNIRPIVPANHHRSQHLLWLQGTYTSYTNYNTKVMGIFGVPKETLADWRAVHQLSSTSGLDSDRDGASDLLEYALGSDPRSTTSQPNFSWEQQVFSFDYCPQRSDVEWVVETSADLKSWNPRATLRSSGLTHSIDANLGVTFGSQNSNGRTRVEISSLPENGATQHFVRIKAQTSPLPDL